MTHSITRTTLGAAALLALALPSAAHAHTSVYESQTKTAAGTPPTLVAGPVHYLVANHGHNVVLRETNGVTGGGALNYKVLPSAWRSTVNKTQLLATATGAQPHASCSGLAQLDEAAVLAWQEADPFYAYVPWQKGAAGLGDEEEVAKWTAVVKTKTGVDLSTAPDPAAACTALGGTYVAADAVQTTGAALSSGDIALVADPLKASIEAYKTQTDGLGGQLGAAKKATDDAAAAAKAAEARAAGAEAALKAAGAPLAIAYSGGKLTGKTAAKGIAVQLTGAPGTKVVALAQVTTAAKKKAKLPTSTIGTAQATLDAAGKASVTITPSKKTATALGKLKGSLTLGLGVSRADAAATTVKVTG